MKIGVISDTHGDAASWEIIWERDFSSCDVIIHAGDVLYHGPRNPIKPEYAPAKLAQSINDCSVPILIVQGNCDAYVDSMVLNIPIVNAPLYTQVAGQNFIVHHGHDLKECDVELLVKKYQADFFITGHTHIPILELRNNYCYINPGSSSLPKNESKEATYVIIEDGLVSLKNLEGKVIKKVESL